MINLKLVRCVDIKVLYVISAIQHVTTAGHLRCSCIPYPKILDSFMDGFPYFCISISCKNVKSSCSGPPGVLSSTSSLPGMFLYPIIIMGNPTNTNLWNWKQSKSSNLAKIPVEFFPAQSTALAATPSSTALSPSWSLSRVYRAPPGSPWDSGIGYSVGKGSRKILWDNLACGRLHLKKGSIQKWKLLRGWIISHIFSQ